MKSINIIIDISYRGDFPFLGKGKTDFMVIDIYYILLFISTKKTVTQQQH